MIGEHALGVILGGAARSLPKTLVTATMALRTGHDDWIRRAR
ncbi:hypothetical protein O3597_25865 [Verrucosispora sp. WMMA2044]|nr:hypothetical protein [Verrucosispora sp. WMMA2044]WBB48469.1 hypothetical protein O3597_25865 [Verrucosispora sp. WMMA2044]